MNKREYKLWRRRMRETNREVRRQAREEFAKHGGSFNNDVVVSDKKYTIYTYVKTDNCNVSRTLKKGDFKSTTPYKKVVTTQKGVPLVYYQYWYKTSGRETHGYGAKATNTPTPRWWGAWSDSSAMRSKLMTASQSALLASIYSNAPSWDVMTDLAEGKEAVSLLRDTASKFIHLASMVKRRDIMSIARFFRVSTTRRGIKRLRRRIYHQNTLGGYGVTVGSCMSNLWMSYRYGFMPMIYSMQDAMISLNAKFNEGVKLTEQVTLSDSLFVETANGETITSTGYKAINKSSRSCSGSFRKKAYFNYTNSIWARLIGNPFVSGAKTAWEVVPFSFVADWFVGIGDYLDRLQVDTLTADVSVNVTEKSNSRLTNWFEPTGSPPGYRYTIDRSFGASAVATTFTFERTRGSLSVPGVDLSQSWYTFKRSIDSSCLLWQRFKGHLNEYVDPDTGLKYRVH